MRYKIIPIAALTCFALNLLVMRWAPNIAPAIDPKVHKDSSPRFMFPRLTCPKNPAKEENVTIKAAADAFLGLNPNHTRSGTMIFPPPTPQIKPHIETINSVRAPCVQLHGG